MRDLVNSKLFLLRKKWDDLLSRLLPRTWVPLYTMVTFSRERYHLCIAKKRWQDEVGLADEWPVFFNSFFALVCRSFEVVCVKMVSLVSVLRTYLGIRELVEYHTSTHKSTVTHPQKYKSTVSPTSTAAL